MSKLKKFNCYVKLESWGQVEVEAPNKTQAQNKVAEMDRRGEIHFDAGEIEKIIIEPIQKGGGNNE